MRKFGIICVHDTQQPDLYGDKLVAVRDAANNFSVSITNHPLVQAWRSLESSSHSAIFPRTDTLQDGRLETKIIAFLTVPFGKKISVSPASRHLMAAKIKLGHVLRPDGLRS